MRANNKHRRRTSSETDCKQDSYVEEQLSTQASCLQKSNSKLEPSTPPHIVRLATATATSDVRNDSVESGISADYYDLTSSNTSNYNCSSNESQIISNSSDNNRRPSTSKGTIVPSPCKQTFDSSINNYNNNLNKNIISIYNHSSINNKQQIRQNLPSSPLSHRHSKYNSNISKPVNSNLAACSNRQLKNQTNSFAKTAMQRNSIHMLLANDSLVSSTCQSQLIKTQVKVQLHISTAPDDEPLPGSQHLEKLRRMSNVAAATGNAATVCRPAKQTANILNAVGEQISLKLGRQNSSVSEAARKRAQTMQMLHTQKRASPSPPPSPIATDQDLTSPIKEQISNTTTKNNSTNSTKAKRDSYKRRSQHRRGSNSFSNSECVSKATTSVDALSPVQKLSLNEQNSNLNNRSLPEFEAEPNLTASSNLQDETISELRGFTKTGRHTRRDLLSRKQQACSRSLQSLNNHQSILSSSTSSSTIGELNRNSNLTSKQQLCSSSILALHSLSSPTKSNDFTSNDDEREQIFFKRDGQRFKHECTLKLSINRKYRCLLKIRPSQIQVVRISVEATSVEFVNCSQTPSSSMTNLASSLLSLSSGGSSFGTPPSEYSKANGGRNQRLNSCTVESMTGNKLTNVLRAHQDHLRRGVTCEIATAAAMAAAHVPLQLSKQFAHFTQSNSSVSGHSIYVFDWPAGSVDATRNKARSEIKINVEFNTGQTVSLPLQVKFYEQKCKQHLNWGSLLHFIDYDCRALDTDTQIHVDKVQFY